MYMLPHVQLNGQTQKALTWRKGLSKLLDDLRGQAHPERFFSLGIYSMQYRKIREESILIYRMLKGKIGPDLSELFSPV